MNDRSVDPASPASSITISGSPSEEEAAAVMAAAEALWPKPAQAPSGWAQRNTSWRFSGRWWSRPIPQRRARPWR